MVWTPFNNKMFETFSFCEWCRCTECSAREAFPWALCVDIFWGTYMELNKIVLHDKLWAWRKRACMLVNKWDPRWNRIRCLVHLVLIRWSLALITIEFLNMVSIAATDLMIKTYAAWLEQLILESIKTRDSYCGLFHLWSSHSYIFIHLFIHSFTVV